MSEKVLQQSKLDHFPQCFFLGFLPQAAITDQISREPRIVGQLRTQVHLRLIRQAAGLAMRVINDNISPK